MATKHKKIPDTPDTDNICDAVKLLVTRMESNPDEFTLTKNSKWGDMMNMVRVRHIEHDSSRLCVLSDDEVKLLWDKFCEAGKISLHTEFMRRILAAGDSPNGSEGN